jgi:hypothetical protein
MSPMLLDRPVATLQSVLETAWSDLMHDHTAECPICHAAMRPRYSAAAAIAGGRCEDCGTTLE